MLFGLWDPSTHSGTCNIVLKNCSKDFAMQDVKVIGLNFDGIERLSIAELFPRSLIAAVFQHCGTVLVMVLKMSTRVSLREGISSELGIKWRWS